MRPAAVALPGLFLCWLLMAPGLALSDNCPNPKDWKLSEQELAAALKRHEQWLDGGQEEGAEVRLCNADLSQHKKVRRSLRMANLRGANLSGLDLRDVDLGMADLGGAKLSGADLTKANLNDAILEQASLHSARFANADMLGTDLSKAKLNRADLRGADLSGATLSEAILANADLRGANLSGADLTDAKLYQVQAGGADLTRCDLAKAFLKLANLTKVRLNKATLTGADLTSADLSKADLTEANLSGATLTAANLRLANLSSATLAGANLTDADLSAANFRRVNLSGSIYQPISAPGRGSLTGLLGLTEVRFSAGQQSGLVLLRKALQEAGLRDLERQATFAIESGITRHRLAGIQELPEQNWITSLLARLEGLFRLVFFEWTTRWGLWWGLPLVILLGLIGVMSLVYAVPLLYSAHWPQSGGIYRIWPSGRIEDEQGELRLTDDEVVERLQPSGAAVFGFALYFSLLSAFQIGWREFNVGSWLARLQPREYFLRGRGWVRVVSGAQSLISVYLLAMWALTYFGRPFQ